MSAHMHTGTAYSPSYNATYNPTVILVGRILLALLFVYFGYMKLMNIGGTVNYFTKWEFPMPQVAAWLAVIFELVGGIMIIVGWKTRWAAWALALYVVIAAAVAHRFWTYEAAQVFNQTSHFFKNISIIGGLLLLAGVGPGRYSVDKA